VGTPLSRLVSGSCPCRLPRPGTCLPGPLGVPPAPPAPDFSGTLVGDPVGSSDITARTNPQPLTVAQGL
jgi:hypothetical protein